MLSMIRQLGNQSLRWHKYVPMYCFLHIYYKYTFMWKNYNWNPMISSLKQYHFSIEKNWHKQKQISIGNLWWETFDIFNHSSRGIPRTIFQRYHLGTLMFAEITPCIFVIKCILKPDKPKDELKSLDFLILWMSIV